MSPTPSKQTFRFRTVFISDIHLGFRGCSAAYLLDFLRSVETETLYLVGDVIDVWSLRKSFFWPQAHNDVIRTILGKAKHGTRVVYIPGNHDAMFRDYDGMVFGNVEIHREAIHETADGRRYALGASGGRKIIGAVMQLASFIADHGMDLEQAFHQPRIDVSGVDGLIADAALAPPVIAALSATLPTTTGRRLVFPYSFACPAGVLREGGMNAGCTEVMSPWGDAVTELELAGGAA